MKRILFIIVFCLTALSVSAYSTVANRVNLSGYPPLDTIKRDINKIIFYFRFDNADFDTLYMSNLQSLEKLDKILYYKGKLLDIDTLKVSATSSPEGNYNYNLRLAKLRALSFKEVLNKRYNFSDSTVIETNSYVTSWDKLGAMIEGGNKIPMENSVLDIINSDNTHNVIGWKLKKVGNGRPWRYINVYYLPYLRNNAFYIDIKVKEAIIKNIKAVEKAALLRDTIKHKSDTIIKEDTVATPITQHKVERRNLFAIKTNLLFDALTLINLELEVPIGKRWSIAGEWIFPWWTWDNDQADSKRNRIQMLNGNLEGRYWFGKREKRPQMTGWFAGVYVGGGLYDFEYKAKGYQGEAFIMAGLSGGYAHTINKKGSLRMEYSLGIGYVETNYKYYESCFNLEHMWHAIRREDGRYSYIGPTRAKVSLVWMLNRKVKSGGVR